MESMATKNHIRDDVDPPSDDFAHVLGEDGDQTPESIDPKARPPYKYLICGFGETVAPGRRREIVPTSYVDLLRVDRKC